MSESIKKKVEKIYEKKKGNIHATSELIKWLLNFSLLFFILLFFYYTNPRTTGFLVLQPMNIIVPSLFGLIFLVYFLYFTYFSKRMRR